MVDAACGAASAGSTSRSGGQAYAHAVGAQIYTCVGSGGSNTGDGGANEDAGAPSYAWVLKAPDATLYDFDGTQVGTHGAGPSWTWRDGTVAVGAKVVELNAPTADAISWLLLRVKSTSGVGQLTDVTYVQRLNTVGGRAPASGCDATTVGAETRSNYSADYYFLAGGGAAAWLTTPTVPGEIAVPIDVRLVLHDRGIGEQIYKCAASGGAGAVTYAWHMLFTNVGRLQAGPTWTSGDGSTVIAPPIAQAPSPHADARPWTLYKEQSTTGPGVFQRVAFIQEINTSGGVMPTSACGAANADTQMLVDYAADYYVYVSINDL